MNNNNLLRLDVQNYIKRFNRNMGAIGRRK